MFFFLGWLVLAILVGVLASSKGRSGFGYFLLSVILSPLIGLVVVLIAGENKAALEKARVESGAEVKCYFCAELIKREAKICRHCGKPNHPAYHGPWLRIKEIDSSGLLAGTPAKIGDVVYRYNGIETNGNADVLTAEVGKATGEVPLTLIRDAEEIEIKVKAGKLGVGLAHENTPAATEY